MQETKLHILLSRLSIYEMNRFTKFIASPYHNEDEKLIRLYAYLLPFYKEGKAGNIDRSRVWKKVYGAKTFTNLQFARLLSDLLKKVESFIAQEHMRSDGPDEHYYLLDTYNSMGLAKHFTGPYMHAVSKLEKQPFRDSDYYFHNFRLNVQQNIYLENRKQRTTEKNLIETVRSLDTYYFINKLRYSAAILHYKHFLNLRDESILLPEILAQLGQKPPDTPVVNIYYHVILTLIEPAEERHFTRLKELLFAHTALLQIDTQKEVFAFTLNYCIRKINQGRAAYQAEIFELYKDALRRDLLLDQGTMTPWDYKNIVTIGLRNKAYKWTDSFIDQYIRYLSQEEQDNAYTFNRARHYFATRKYGKVLELLQNVEYNDIFYLLDSKTTLMKTYYELGEYQPLLSLKESFRILLRRKKVISAQNQVNYGNFALFTMKLFRADVKNKKQMEALKKAIQSTSNIADKVWLEEKFAELDPQE
jgi:hypothetical protein